MKSPQAILTHPVPLWALIAAAFLLCGVFVFLLYSLHNRVYNYTVQIPEAGQLDVSTFSYGAHPELENAEYFRQIRDEFIAQRASFVEADLSAMELRLYEKGEVAYDVPILTKGKEGSWWETPAGLYKAQGKIENHFSSFADVYLPSSIPFQGNFFIHGWPYYPDGTPVESNFSGGCIRLSAEDAGKIYEAIRVGTPILVHEKDFAPDTFSYQVKTPETAAASFLVADLKSNFVVMQKNPKNSLPIASLTKLVTATIATEYINIEKEITVPQKAIVQTSTPRLKAGQRISVYDLLYPLLQESSNEAAETLTYILGPSYFVNLMNEKTSSLGMRDTRLKDASGMSPENVSTAEDLFNLAKYMYNNRGFLLGVSAGRVERPDLYGQPYYRNLENFNVYATDPSFVGGKIGKTNAAKETFLGVFEFEVRGEKRPIALIVLGSENVAQDTRLILEHLRDLYVEA